MNRAYVLDASAMLVLLDNRPDALRINKLIEEGDRLNATLLASVVNLGEVFYLSCISLGSVMESKLPVTLWTISPIFQSRYCRSTPLRP